MTNRCEKEVEYIEVSFLQPVEKFTVAVKKIHAESLRTFLESKELRVSLEEDAIRSSDSGNEDLLIEKRMGDTGNAVTPEALKLLVDEWKTEYCKES